MNRSTAREIAVRICFYADASGRSVSDISESFFDREYYDTLASTDEVFAEYPEKKQLGYIMRLVSGVEEHRTELDTYIEKYAHGWKIGRISKTALAVLRCALCEIVYMDDIPDATAINEAVELSKGYDDADTVSFINGVLGGFMRGETDKSENE